MRTHRTLQATFSALLTSMAVFAASADAMAQAAPAAPAVAAAGDAKLGEGKAAMCIGCHGIPFYQASFPEVYKVPMISGQSAKYIAAALTAYRKGDRKHPTMRAVATSLTDKDILDLAAFYETHTVASTPLPPKATEPSAHVAELLKKANCASCHGDNFSKPIDPSYPKIAGQYADYLYVALKAYQIGGTNGHVGRVNPIMGGMASQYKHDELKDLAKYLSTLPTELQTVPQSRFR